MSQPDQPEETIDLSEQALANLISDLADRAQAGEPLDLESVCLDHPKFEKDIRQLWGTVVVTQAIGANASAPSDENDDKMDSVSSLKLPYNFGDYTLEEEIGRGGMGVVYKANQRSLNRSVAVKLILKGELASRVDRQRFRTEAESVAQLSHPNIVAVNEVGEIDGRSFIAMRLISGQTLNDRLQAGPLPPQQAAKIMVEVCHAIEFAHGKGVLHRDLKPSNILMGQSGVCYVADFGLAKRTEGGTITNSESIIGTPSYMPPEQASGARRVMGPESDVYSLGAILYHMLTGRPPFQSASPVDTVLMVIEQDPVAPRLINRKVDRDLEMIALRCLQKPQDLRYPSAKALADDLQAYLNHEPIKARDGRLAQVVAHWFRETHHASVLRNWGLLWMWHSLVLFAACLATNTLWWLNDQTPWHYGLLWTAGFGAWALVFWWLRRRMGPVTFVERQIAHVWAASLVSTIILFPIEAMLHLPVLSLSPVLGLIAGSTFLAKAGILSGSFYIPAVLMFLTSFLMCAFPDFAHVIFGTIAGGCFFFYGLKYHRQRLFQEKNALGD